MDDQNAIQRFDDKHICTAWDPEQEKWFFPLWM